MKIGNLEVYGIIYKIKNLTNGKCYIGATTQGFDKRYKNNFFKYTSNLEIKKDIEIYGKDKFEICKIIDIAFSKTELNIKEKTQILINNAFNDSNGYNFTDGGTKGTVYSKETKNKIKENALKHSKIISNNAKLRWKTKEYREKVVNSVKKSWTEERRKKASISTKKSYTDELLKERRNQSINNWKDENFRKKAIYNMKKEYIVIDTIKNEIYKFKGREEVANFLKKSISSVKKYLIKGKSPDGRYIVKNSIKI